MIQIITDSTSGITQDEAKSLGITVLPINIDFDNEIFYDGVNLTSEQFWEKLTESNALPATLQPNALEYLERFESAKNNGESLLVITPSSNMSGIYNSAKLYCDEVEHGELAVLDSQNISYGMRLVVLEAVKNREKMALGELVDHLNKFKLHIRSFATMDNLDALLKSERLDGNANLPKCVLNIKPIITMQNGNLCYVDKKVGTKNAIDYIITQMKADKISSDYPISIQYTRNSAKCDYPAEMLKQLFSEKTIQTSAIPYLLCPYLGDNATVITYVIK